MSLIDSHAHLDGFVSSGDVESMLERARASAVTRIVAIGGTPDANRTAVQLAERHSEIVATVGYDRDEAARPPVLDGLRVWAGHPRVVGIGETGLDYHYSAETAREQIRLFSSMLEIAAEYRKPVIVHSRDADEDTLRALKLFGSSWRGGGPPGVLHCFTGTRAFAEQLVEMGLMIGFSGIITFKNADTLREVARWVPDDHLLVETDAPYLAPVPYRGKPNEPAWVAHVAAKLAEIRGVTPDDMARITSANANRLFRV